MSKAGLRVVTPCLWMRGPDHTVFENLRSIWLFRIGSESHRVPGLLNCHSHWFQRVIRRRTEHQTTAIAIRSGPGARRCITLQIYVAGGRLLRSADDFPGNADVRNSTVANSTICTMRLTAYVYGKPNLLAMQILRAANDVGIRISLLRAAYARAGWKTAAHAGQARFVTAQNRNLLQDADNT